jgi:hypothetical protein
MSNTSRSRRRSVTMALTLMGIAVATAATTLDAPPASAQTDCYAVLEPLVKSVANKETIQPTDQQSTCANEVLGVEK